ncbi:AI-2 transport protein TqsA [Candidatus Nitrotoga sp. BS]|uniref:AI-2E family transporter n=1 Tax=Candidatus Nitrotoga sp. BS TaxID=2890408 RepID=UPI001EF264A8|nr:AI-2E family transporter [Candidatus Nitrotoga sp. BS]CAH1204076.1 AI-2 transport protein TqsA [Candidatus Nitrotoga sp. BS]
MKSTIAEAPIPEPETPAPAVADSVIAKESVADNADDTGNAEHDKSVPVLPSSPLAGLLPTPVDARGLALAILAMLACIFALQWAQKFLVPVLFGILIAYTLNPLVAWLERRKIPRRIGVSLIMLSILGGSAAIGNTLYGEYQSILENLPAASHKISRLLSKSGKGQPNAIQKMQTAATEIEKATSSATGAPAPSSRKVVAPEAPVFQVKDWLWAGSRGAAGFVMNVVMVIFLVFFLLLSGDTFKRKLVRLTGPSMSRKKITVHILDDINKSIQSYMFMLLVTNVLLAILMWIALRLIGMQNTGAWALAAGLFHVIPYFGPLLITISTGVAAFMQFESASMGFLVAGVSLAIATLVGTLVTTWMTGRIAKMNAPAVFISLLFWGWLWGIWGLLLGIPIIFIVKVISSHVEGLLPVAELLSE